MRYVPYIIAILCVLYAFTEVRAQDRSRWRVTYINDINQEIRLGTKYSLGGCIAAIKLIYAEESKHYYCTADIEAAQSTPNTAAKISARKEGTK